MISGTNIILVPPTWEWKSNRLRDNKEIQSLERCLVKYYSQKQVIYEATLVLSNSEWQTLNSKYGKYRKRIDYSVELMKLKKVNVYGRHIDFTVDDNGHDAVVRVVVTDNFFYSIECEDDFY